MVTYLAVTHVGQDFPSMLQVAQTGVDHTISVADQLHAVLITGPWSANTFVLRTV